MAWRVHCHRASVPKEQLHCVKGKPYTCAILYHVVWGVRRGWGWQSCTPVLLMRATRLYLLHTHVVCACQFVLPAAAIEYQYPPHLRQGSFAEEGRSVNTLKVRTKITCYAWHWCS